MNIYMYGTIFLLTNYIFVMLDTELATVKLVVLEFYVLRLLFCLSKL